MEKPKTIKDFSDLFKRLEGEYGPNTPVNFRLKEDGDDEDPLVLFDVAFQRKAHLFENDSSESITIVIDSDYSGL